MKNPSIVGIILAFGLSSASAQAASWECKCSHVSGQQRREKGEYQRDFSMSTAGDFTMSTPCNGANMTSRLQVVKGSAKLSVFKADGKEVGDEREEGIESKDRFYLKFDPDMKHDATWLSKRTIQIPQQDIQAVVFCMRVSSQSIHGGTQKDLKGDVGGAGGPEDKSGSSQAH